MILYYFLSKLGIQSYFIPSISIFVNSNKLYLCYFSYLFINNLINVYSIFFADKNAFYCYQILFLFKLFYHRSLFQVLLISVQFSHFCPISPLFTLFSFETILPISIVVYHFMVYSIRGFI